MATYQDKIDRIVGSLTERTSLMNIVPGSMAGQLVQSVAYEQMNLEKILEDDAMANSLLSATGSKLDTIGNSFFGIARRPSISTAVTDSMKALKFYVKTGTFGDINNNLPIIVPQGTIIEGTINSLTIRLRLTSDVTLVATDSEKYISAELVQGPNDILPSGTINRHYHKNYARALNSALLITNSSLIATGRPEETDNNYRYRLANSLSAFTRTNTDGIKETVNSIPGVSYSEVDQSSNGGGTFAIYVQGVSPITSDELILDVEFALSNQIPPWVMYNISKMNYVGLQMTLNLNVRNPSFYVGNTSFITGVQDAVATYINNFSYKQFEVHSILDVIKNYNNDITDVTFSFINKFTGVGLSRSYTTIDFTVDEAPIIFLTSIEKLVVEPVQNAITVLVQ